VTGGSGDTLEERRKSYYEIIRNLPSGVSEIILHLSTDDPEIRAITGAWQYRYHEFLIFTDREARKFIESEGIKLIGYRQLADLYKQRKK
jgi:predicted glycoside hydrolase/deacetylase ChbG (UPF0249 family)